jgi:hypothetical protein
MDMPVRTLAAQPALPAPLHPALRRFARQVQLGFTLALGLCLGMLVLHG